MRTNSHCWVERGIALAAEQYRKAVEKFSSKSVQDMQPADVQTDLEQNTESQTAGDIPAHTSLETLEQSELDWDPYELFSASEDSAASNTDTAADSPMLSEGIENTEAFEQSFLSGLQSDEESGIMQIESHEETVEPAQTAKAAEQPQKPLTAQERLALLGAALLEKGGMPNDAQLTAMGMDEATARGIQSLVLLSKENNPAARRKVEAMIDQTAPEAQEEQRGADNTKNPADARVNTRANSYIPNRFGTKVGPVDFQTEEFVGETDNNHQDERALHGSQTDAGGFQIKDWTGYPSLVKPTGPFRILNGEEYDVARKLANKTNANIHARRPDLAGMQIHEIHPVKFGGSPTDISNKLALTPKEHAKYTAFWNRVLRELQQGEGEAK